MRAEVRVGEEDSSHVLSHCQPTLTLPPVWDHKQLLVRMESLGQRLLHHSSCSHPSHPPSYLTPTLPSPHSPSMHPTPLTIASPPFPSLTPHTLTLPTSMHSHPLTSFPSITTLTLPLRIHNLSPCIPTPTPAPPSPPLTHTSTHIPAEQTR